MAYPKKTRAQVGREELRKKIIAFEQQEHRTQYLKEKAERDNSPIAIRDKKARLILQHNSKFLKEHKKNEPTLSEYEAECRYMVKELIPLIKSDLENDNITFEQVDEIIKFYALNFNIISKYSQMITKEKPNINIYAELFNELINLNAYFMCFAPKGSFRKENLPFDKIANADAYKTLQANIENLGLLEDETFVNLYADYLNLNITI